MQQFAFEDYISIQQDGNKIRDKEMEWQQQHTHNIIGHTNTHNIKSHPQPPSHTHSTRINCVGPTPLPSTSGHFRDNLNHLHCRKGRGYPAPHTKQHHSHLINPFSGGSLDESTRMYCTSVHFDSILKEPVWRIWNDLIRIRIPLFIYVVTNTLNIKNI